MLKKPAVFLDRDGTINYDSGYLYKIDQWQWLSNAQDALVQLYEAGFCLIVVTNQSGIARKLYTDHDVNTLHNWINTELSILRCKITAFYHCPHLPEISGACSCRKPAAGMLLQAAKEHNLDLTRSWMIGDRLSDVEAGITAGCKTLFIDDKKQHQHSFTQEDNYKGQVANLYEAAQIICASKK